MKGPVRYIALLFAFITILFAHSSYSQVDSLKKVLTVTKSDTGKINILNKIGEVYDDKGAYRLAIDAYNKALSLSVAVKDYKNVLNGHIRMGNLYSRQSIYSSALEEYLTAIKINEDHLRSERITAIISENIGNIYTEENDTLRGKKFYTDALNIFEKLNDQGRNAILLGNIGNMYMRAGDYKKADTYLQDAAEKLVKANDAEGLALCYTNLGDLSARTKEYSNAFEYYQKALQMQEESGDSERQAITLSGISSLYFQLGDYKRSEDAGVKSFEIAKNINLVKILRDEGKVLSDLYEKSNQPGRAYLYYKQYVKAKDSMDNKMMAERITRDELNYEFDQQKQAEQLQDEKREALNEANAHHQKVILIISIGGLILVLLLTILLLKNFLRVRSSNKIITEQKALVEEKNKDILDSINYAKRLQDAILPPLHLVKQNLPDSFLFYKPKDIVAGDFYWMWRDVLPNGEDSGGALILIAAADCTGHGVPGAMVSVVCSNALNRTVKEFHITEPGKILDKVREMVLETFEKSEGNIQDGMDISLCSINTKTRDVQWSGAFNSLLYIHKGELKEVPADKQPIGKSDNAKPFNTHNLNLQKGDTLYLFTDGYADQFGGPKGKKFKYKQLEELLLANAAKPMDEQKKILADTLQTWKGSLEQVDDILIIGIRV